MEQEITLLPEALHLKYNTEEEMLRDLYEVKGISIGKIAEKLGYASYKIRKRMNALGIVIKPRGGPNHIKRVLAHLTDEELASESIRSIAAKYAVNEQTVIFERRRRRRIATALKFSSQLQQMLDDHAPKES